MSSHINRSYLNSCLKVPIDPCNSCPAPVFNRPKIYLGHLSTTPNTSTSDVICCETSTESKQSYGVIRALAKLYDSIPDYGDLNHLKGEEFFTTLNALRSTCRELRVKASGSSSVDRCSTTATSSLLTSSNSQLGEGRSRKCKMSKKKKSTEIKNHKKYYESKEPSDLAPRFLNTEKHEKSNAAIPTDARHCSLPKSSKKSLDKEVESFKKSLQELEAEFKRPLASVNRNESQLFPHCSSKKFETNSQGDSKTPNEKVPVRNTFTSTFRERLRKSLSVNDLHSLIEPPELAELRKNNKTLELLSFKGQRNALQDPQKLSSYFLEKPKPEAAGTPNITVDSPSNEQATADGLQGRPKAKEKRNQTEEYKMSLKLFNLDTSKKERVHKHSTPSPIHPVARPNLAATLRAENAKQKIKELGNNCTFQDTTQFDWEVRKTPAWKTLSLNESHNEILKLRLATRKAEQALQQREYELNMELMRQRVKSAPLLLEGPTYWGPHVGKLSHVCQKDARRHMCQSNHQRTRRRKNSSRHSCKHRMMLFSNSPPLDEEHSGNTSNTFRVQSESSSAVAHKLKNTLCKIYGTGSNIAKSESRNSNHSTNTQQSLKCQRKNNSKSVLKNKKKSCKDDSNFEVVEINSGDELSSLDRAFL